MNTSILHVEISGERGSGKTTLAQEMYEQLQNLYNVEVLDEGRVSSRTPFVAGRPGVQIYVKGNS